MELILTDEEKQIIVDFRKARLKELVVEQDHYNYLGDVDPTHTDRIRFKYDTNECVKISTSHSAKNKMSSSGFFGYHLRPKQAREIIQFLQEFLEVANDK